jgi:hypothetical protein
MKRLRRRVAHPGDDIAGVDNAHRFSAIVDDCDTIQPVTRVLP